MKLHQINAQLQHEIGLKLLAKAENLALLANAETAAADWWKPCTSVWLGNCTGPGCPSFEGLQERTTLESALPRGLVTGRPGVQAGAWATVLDILDILG